MADETHDVVLTVSPTGLKALHKELRASKGDVYQWLDTAETHHEHEGYQIWEWYGIQWGAEIHNVVLHGLMAVPVSEFRLVILGNETNDLEWEGRLTGPFDVIPCKKKASNKAGTIEQGFKTNWIHVDVGYARSWDEFGPDGSSVTPLGKQGQKTIH